MRLALPHTGRKNLKGPFLVADHPACRSAPRDRETDNSEKPNPKQLGFQVHPFLLAHPDAVFVHSTSISSKADSEKIRTVSYGLCRDLIVPTTGGHSHATPVVIKPNWTHIPLSPGKNFPQPVGSHTDARFVEGWIEGFKALGCERIFLQECSPATLWDTLGYRRLAERHNVNFRDLASRHVWELKEGNEFHFVEIPDGVVFKKIAYLAPVNEPETFLVNIAKLKTHSMGITGAAKNLQGTCARAFHEFCHAQILTHQPETARYKQFFRRGFQQRVEGLYAAHIRQGIPRWARPGPRGGLWMEYWAQSTLDSLSVTRPALNLVEGIFAQDGDGFGRGPHNGRSREYPANLVLFGLNPLRVDMIAHWIAGHHPHNFGLFHLAITRGMLNVLDPQEIPLFAWTNSRGIRTELAAIPRTPLLTRYLTRDFAGLDEPEYHMCDEPPDR